jgi:hypothetical protein
MLVRSWTGWTRTSDADAYVEYMHEVALTGYADTVGNRGVLMLRRDLPDGRTEFTMITAWEDWDSVRAFAGDDPEKAVFYPRDEAFLVDREMTVRHYEVYGSMPFSGLGTTAPKDTP